MSLYNKIQKQIEMSVQLFCERLVEKHEGLDVEEMMLLWKEVSTNKKNAVKNSKRKTSAYVAFSTHMRRLLKEESPSMTFGELSREIGRRWKEMSLEEKNAFIPKSDDVVGATDVAETTTMTTSTSTSTTIETAVDHSKEDDDVLEATVTDTMIVSSSPNVSESCLSECSETDIHSLDMMASDGEEKTTSVEDTETCTMMVDADEEEVPVADLANTYKKYKKMTMMELTQRCKARGLNCKGMKKKESVIQLLLNHPSSS